MRITKEILASVAAIGLFATSAFASPVSVGFKNTSDWSIDHVYLSPSDQNAWGPDQLGEGDSDVIGSGEKFTLTKVEPGKYDIKLVDEDGDECVVEGLKLGESGELNITNENLMKCQAATDKGAEDAEK